MADKFGRKGLICVALALMCFSGWATKPESDSVPMELSQAAHAFRLKDPADRYEEGMRVCRLLPTSISSEKDIGTGLLITHDYTHPSFRITKEKLIELLGKPDSERDDKVYYTIGNRTDHGANPSLIITLQNNLVVEASAILA